MFNDIWLEGPLLWNLPLLAFLIGTAVLYVCLLLTYTKIKIHQKQLLLFFLSIGILYLTIGSPLSTFSHLSFSLHMLQMSILYFILPPLFLLGIPASFLQQCWKPSRVKQVSKFVLPPKTALYAFGVLFFVYHVPVVLTFLSQNSFVHNGYQVVLLVLSFSMWRPIAESDPKKYVSKGQRKRYVFLSGLVLMPACLLFILTAFIGGMNNPLLTQMTANLCISPSTLSSYNILPAPFNTRFDQMMAGILMMGMHKFGLILTCYLKNKIKSGTRVEMVD